MKNELWLEFGKINNDGWHDVFWYNEGNASEIGYFLKNFIRDLFVPNKYYYLKYGKMVVNLRGQKLSSRSQNDEK